MKERIISGLEKIARIEQVETPEEAKQNRSEYLDALEQQLSLPSHILNGFLDEETGGRIIWTSQTYENWKFLDSVKSTYKLDQENVFRKIFYSGTDFSKTFDSRPEEYIDENGIPTLSNGYRCNIDKLIPSNVDLMIGNKIRIPLKRRIEKIPNENYDYCPLPQSFTKKTPEIIMEPEIPYTPERAELDIWRFYDLIR
jgi:hypothetical protein